jgi:hypothetical protein
MQLEGSSPLNSSSFTSSFESLTSKHSSKHRQKLLQKLIPHGTKHAHHHHHHPNSTNQSISTARSQNTKQYFQIENYCEHTPKTNPSVDHHSSRFMPLVPILKKPSPKTNSSGDLKSLRPSSNLVKSFVLDEKQEATVQQNDAVKIIADDTSAEENMSLKEIVKTLYDSLYDRMLQVSKTKRVVIKKSETVEPVSANRARSVKSGGSAKSDLKKQNSRKKLVSNEPILSQVTEGKVTDEEEYAKKVLAYSSTSKIELSLDKEIFELEKMRQTPKLIAMQKRHNRMLGNVQPPKSMKESIHGLLSLYDTEGAVRATRKLRRDSFDANLSDGGNEFDSSMSRLNNTKSSVSFVSNREKNSVML